jgi:twitching motility two-component system response regulator PilG
MFVFFGNAPSPTVSTRWSALGDHDGCNMATSNSESLIEQTVTAAKSGNRSLAELHFRQVMQQHSEVIEDPDLWLMMAWLAPSPLAMSQILQSFLANHPTNELAQQGLRWAEGIANLALTPTKVPPPAAEANQSVQSTLATDIASAPYPTPIADVSGAPPTELGPANLDVPASEDTSSSPSPNHPYESITSIESGKSSDAANRLDFSSSGHDQDPSVIAYGFVPLEDSTPQEEYDRMFDSHASSTDQTESFDYEPPARVDHQQSRFEMTRHPSAGDPYSLDPFDELASLPEMVPADPKPYVIAETSELNQAESMWDVLREPTSFTSRTSQDPPEFSTTEVSVRASDLPTQTPMPNSASLATTIQTVLPVKTESWATRPAAEDIQILQKEISQQFGNAVQAGQALENERSIRPELLMDLSNPPPTEHSEETSANHKPTGPSILVVDDSPTVRKLLTMMLSQAGYDVLSAIDGVDAIRSIAAHIPQLIITDINMPRLDGYKLCKLVTRDAQTKHIPVIMISGGIIDRLRGKLAGCAGYLEKPITPASLAAVVEFALQGSAVRT